MKKNIGAIFLLGLFSLNALADEESNKTVTNIGAQGVDGYFRVAEALAKPCAYGVIYFSGNNYQSLLLAAKFAGKKLSRINYSFDASSQICRLVLAEVE